MNTMGLRRKKGQREHRQGCVGESITDTNRMGSACSVQKELKSVTPLDTLLLCLWYPVHNPWSLSAAGPFNRTLPSGSSQFQEKRSGSVFLRLHFVKVLGRE